jgi:hypothetical protein
MRNFAAPFLFALALGACASSGPRTYTGIYVTGMSVETFYQEGKREPYWVTAERSARDDLTAPIPAAMTPGAGARVAVVVEGERSGRGRYGPLGAYDREILIRRVVSARLIDPAPEGAAAVEPAPEPAPARRRWRWPWSNPETVPPPPPEPPAEEPAVEPAAPGATAPRPWLRWPWGRRPG